MSQEKISDRIYPSKLLLFGEHTVNSGSQALAMPLNLYKGQWIYQKEEDHPSRPYLHELLEYLTQLNNQKELLVDCDLSGFRQMLKDSLAFESDIPIGYGLGSSGALSAAVYDLFCLGNISLEVRQETEKDMRLLKKHLGQIESYFHGSSSGIDPLVSYLQQGVYIESKNEIQSISIPKSGNGKGGLFLLNTQIERRTAPYVKIYLDKCKNEIFERKCITELAAYNDDAIHAFLKKDWGNLWELFHKISLFQYRYFKEMIPDDFFQLWLDGLADGHYKLKLCGAGGGGFILGCCQEFTKVEELIEGYELVKVFSF